MKRIALGFVFVALACGAVRSPAGAAGDASLAPVLGASEGWLNTSGAAPDVRGKVVIVDVFTFGCYNCRNVVPNLRKLDAARNAGLAIVGVHSPETPYERVRSNVVDRLHSQGISWPVALDNSFAIWKAYDVQAWPTQLLFDRHGRLRNTFVGDSQDARVDAAVDALLAEK